MTPLLDYLSPGWLLSRVLRWETRWTIDYLADFSYPTLELSQGPGERKLVALDCTCRIGVIHGALE